MFDRTGEDNTPLTADQIDLVALDVDRTLLCADKSVSVGVATAVAEVCERGVHVVLASGRAPRQLRQVYEGLGLSTPAICYDGAMVCDLHRNMVLEHHPIGPEVAHEIVEIGRYLHPQIGLAVELGDRYIVERPSTAATGSGTLGLSGPTNLKRALEHPITRITMVQELPVLAKIEAALMQRFRDQLAFPPNQARVLEVVHGTASKAKALARVAQRLNIPRERVMVIGSGPKDLPMLKWAGLRVAMRDADDLIHRAANFVVPSCDRDGVAQALRQYALCRA